MRYTNPQLILQFLDLGTSITISSDYIVRQSIKIQDQWVNDNLESSSSTSSLQLHQECPAIMDILNAEGDIRAVLSDENTVLFTGYLSDGFSWGITSLGKRALNLTLEDVGTRLLPKPYIKSGGKVRLEGEADTIVRTIASSAGVVLDDDFPVISTDVLRIVEIGETCQDLIKSLLKEVGYAYFFTNEGKMDGRKIDCTSTTGVPVLNKDDLYVVGGNALTLSKKMRQYKSSKVTYYSVGRKYGTLVYKDISGQTEDHPDCYIELTNGQTYPSQDGSVSYIEVEDLSGGNEVVYVENVVPEVEVERGTVTSSITQYGADTLSVLLTCTNTGGYSSAIVNKLQAKADLIYKSSEDDIVAGEITSSSSSDNMVSTECKWVHDRTAADALANLLVDYNKFCNRQFTFYAGNNYSLGDIIKINDDEYSQLAVNVMIVGKVTLDKTDIYTYKAVSVSAFDLTKSTTSTKTNSAPTSFNVATGGGKAYFFDLNLSSSVYKRNYRKLTNQQIQMSISVSGYTETSATVTVDGGSFSPTTSVTTSTVPVGTNVTLYVPYNNTYDTITVRAILNSATNVRKVISAVNETEDWYYLGALNSVAAPYNYGFDRFAAGDHFLAAIDFTTDGISFMKGNAYFYTGEAWGLVTAEALDASGVKMGVDFYATVMSNCLEDGVSISAPNQSQIGSWIKKLASHEIITDVIMAKHLIMTSNGSLQSAQYAETDGYPTSGYKLTSNDGTLKAMNAMLRDVNIKCTDSQNKVLLQTQRYQAGDTNIPVRNTSLSARWLIDEADPYVSDSMKSCTYNGNDRRIYRSDNVEYTYGFRYLIGNYTRLSGGGSTGGYNWGNGLFTAPVAGYYFVKCYGVLNNVYPGVMMSNGAVYGRSNSGTFQMDIGYLNQGDQFLALTCTGFEVYVYSDTRHYEISTYRTDTLNYDGSWGTFTGSSSFRGSTYIPEVWVNSGSYMNLSLVVGNFNSEDYRNCYALSNELASWSEGSYNTINSSVTGGSQNLSVTNIGKASNIITFRDNSYNTITVSLPVSTDNIATTGWYKNLGGTINLIGQQSGILTYNVLPSTNRSCSCGTTGQAWAEVVSYGFNSLSARSEKENIERFEDNATNIINNTEIVSFNYKNKPEYKVGFIADDTNEIMAGEEHNKYDLNNCVGLLLKAVQELSARLDVLETTSGDEL